MQSQVGPSGFLMERQGLKRKQSGDMTDYASKLDIANIQRELLFTQHQLQVLRLQYYQLHQKCQTSILGPNSSMQFGTLATQPHSWAGMSTMQHKRHSLLTQVLLLLLCIHAFLQHACKTGSAGPASYVLERSSVSVQCFVCFVCFMVGQLSKFRAIYLCA